MDSPVDSGGPEDGDADIFDRVNNDHKEGMARQYGGACPTGCKRPVGVDTGAGECAVSMAISCRQCYWIPERCQWRVRGGVVFTMAKAADHVCGDGRSQTPSIRCRLRARQVGQRCGDAPASES